MEEESDQDEKPLCEELQEKLDALQRDHLIVTRELEELSKKRKRQDDSSSSSTARPKTLEEQEEERERDKKLKRACNEQPLVGANGLVDGRSNARMAFEQKCQQLRDFKKKFGHCAVPWPRKKEKDSPVVVGPYDALARWVNKQREWYRKYQKGERSTLDAERIAILEEIGIEWNPQLTLLPPDWDSMYERLVKFHDKHGHCCVAVVFKAKKDAEFCNWVADHKQLLYFLQQSKGDHERFMFVSRRAGKSRLATDFSKERQEKLLDFDCMWLNSCITEQWYASFEKLKAFKKENGHCLVAKDDRPLGKWVYKHQRLYRHFYDEDNTLKKELKPGVERKVQILREIGCPLSLKEIKDAREDRYRIAKQRVAESKEQGKQLIKEARQKAKKIVSDAQREAAELLQKAEENMAKFKPKEIEVITVDNTESEQGNPKSAASTKKKKDSGTANSKPAPKLPPPATRPAAKLPPPPNVPVVQAPFGLYPHPPHFPMGMLPFPPPGPPFPFLVPQPMVPPNVPQRPAEVTNKAGPPKKAPGTTRVMYLNASK